jgi:hypothetical protein
LGGATPAAGKIALLPGSAATFANVLTWAKGITSIAIDLAGLPTGTSLSPGNFTLEVGTGGIWSGLPTAPAVTVFRRSGAAGADRVTLTLPDGLVRNTWLRVTVKATPATGLASSDVFYFGSLVGDTGNGRGNPTVNALDLARVRRAIRRTDRESLNYYDFNRDGVINAVDGLIVRSNLRHTLPLFMAPVPTMSSPVASAGGVGLSRASIRQQRRGLLGWDGSTLPA